MLAGLPSPAGHVNGCCFMQLLSPLPIHRPKLFAEISEVMPSTATIDYNDEEAHHCIITVPPFLPTDSSVHSDYPSPLHKIHVLPIITQEETSQLLSLARAHANKHQSWDKKDSSRHASYPTVDFALDESVEVSEYMDEIQFEERMFSALGEAFDVDAEDLSFLDLFCASYEAKKGTFTGDEEEGRSTMDCLNFHRDGSLLSFTILLSPPEEFEGGGTIFDALGYAESGEDNLQPPGVIQPPHAGYATLHSGKMLHGGYKVTKGQRIVLVGFVDVHERNIKTGALGNATKEWGRNDVAEYWNKRRLSLLKHQQQHHITEKGNDIEQPRWNLKNWRYLPKEGRSYFGKNSRIPDGILKNMEHRSSPQNVRRRRLIAEDILLREVLLPRDERHEKNVEEDGGWMEVVGIEGIDGLELGWENENII